ncbi:MAG: hypothetical protein FJ033_01615 [Chloroflexi bacterium]|nr:hypothetical protein [Chloroflexota bacterium]
MIDDIRRTVRLPEGLIADEDRFLTRIATNLGERPPLDPDPAALLQTFGGPEPRPGTDDATYYLMWAQRLLAHPLPSNRQVPAPGLHGMLLDRLRRPLHALIRYYVDAQAARQEEIATWLVRAVTALATAEIEIERLRARVESLERASGSPSHDRT